MSHDPLPGLLRSFNLTTMAGIYAATLKSAEADHWGWIVQVRRLSLGTHAELRVLGEIPRERAFCPNLGIAGPFVMNLLHADVCQDAVRLRGAQSGRDRDEAGVRKVGRNGQACAGADVPSQRQRAVARLGRCRERHRVPRRHRVGRGSDDRDFIDLDGGVGRTGAAVGRGDDRFTALPRCEDRSQAVADNCFASRN